MRSKETTARCLQHNQGEDSMSTRKGQRMSTWGNARWYRLLAVMMVSALFLAACGGEESADGEGTTDGGDSDGSGATETDDGSGGTEDAADEAEGEPLTFGILTHQTGGIAAIGIDHVNGIKAGVALATNGTNQIAGRPIEFVVADDASESGEAARVARQMIQQSQPDIVFGFPSSASAMASTQIMIDAQIPEIYCIAATDGLSGIAPTSFRTSRNARQEAQMGVRVVGIEEGQTFAILAPDYEYGQSAAKAWQELLTDQGGEMVGDIVYAPLVAEDYTAAVERVRQVNAEIVVVVTFASTGGPLLWNTIGDAGIADSAEVYTLLPQKSPREAMGPVAEKVKYFAIYDPELPENELNQQFIEEFQSLTETPIDIYAGDCGVAGMLAVKALEETQGDASPDALVCALEGIQGESVKGDYEVRAEDHVFLQSFYEARLNEDLTAELVETFPPEDSAIPVIETDWEPCDS